MAANTRDGMYERANFLACRTRDQARPIESFRALTGDMVEAARRELGILSYQRFVSGDGKTVHVYERYADSAAALTHLGIFTKKFAELFHDMVERKCFVVFDYPTTELQAALDAFGAIYFEPLGDFAYRA